MRITQKFNKTKTKIGSKQQVSQFEDKIFIITLKLRDF